MFHEGFGIFVESAWERYFASQNVFIDSHWVFIIEWIDSCVHFINEYTESPPINGFSMSLVKDDLRSNVFRSSTNSEGSAFIENFSKSKISQFQVAIIGNEKIFRF